MNGNLKIKELLLMNGMETACLSCTITNLK